MKIFQIVVLSITLIISAKIISAKAVIISAKADWYEDDHKLVGYDFLQGIQDIIGSDPNLPENEIATKPFSGSFSTIRSQDDPALDTTSYCLTDQACGHWDAYSSNDVPLYLLDCNTFCYIDKDSKTYQPSLKFDTQHPPVSYLNCGWETCG